MTKMTEPRHGLSLQWLDADARHVDWSDFREDEGYSPVLPAPTYGDWQERDNGDAPAAIKRAGSRKRSQPLPDDLRDEFEQSDCYDEWRDSFEPMMNYAWPVSLSYNGPSEEDAAQLIERFGPACVLIEFTDEARERLGWNDSNAPDYAIALTGGGMDLSDNIAAAYLACGCVPPQRVLSGLSGVMRREAARRMPLRAAYRKAAEHYRFRAQQLQKEALRLFKAA